MLVILNEKFDSLLKRLDIIYALERAKPVTRIMVKQEEYNGIKEFLNGHKLLVDRADFKVLKLDSTPYSNKGEKIGADDRKKGYYFVYLSRSRAAIRRAKKHEANDNHYKLGIALGYPRCCSRFFQDQAHVQSEKANDFTLAALRNSEGFLFPFYNNFAARHFDLSLLSHFPCSFHCQSSAKIAKNNLNIVEQYSIQHEALLRKMLKEPIIYTSNYGVFMLRDAHINGKKVSYSGIMASQNNKLSALLRGNKQLHVADKNHIRVGDQRIKTGNMGFMCFF